MSRDIAEGGWEEVGGVGVEGDEEEEEWEE